MTSLWIWAASLAIGLTAVVLGAAVGGPAAHIVLTALVCLGFAILAVWQRRQLVAEGAGNSALSSATAAFMGLVWAWAALTLLLTYVFILRWHEWWQYVLAAAAAAALCLFFAAILSRDAANKRDDETMLQLARYLTVGQLGGMVIAMIGLVIDDKMPRNPALPDWAASNIFFFGAAALAAISASALWGAQPKTERA